MSQVLSPLLKRLETLDRVHENLDRAHLCQMVIERGEAVFSNTGALVTKTGKHTGRSAKDKYIVKDAQTENTIWWDKNPSLSPASFKTLFEDMLSFAEKMEMFRQYLFAGASVPYRFPVVVTTSQAWQSLFIRNLLITAPFEKKLFHTQEALTILCLPEFQADPQRHGTKGTTAIALDFTCNMILIAGTAYAGEIKKSVFTTLNYHLPDRDVMPMHCSVNHSLDEKNSAIFFGLSGTGKTTLSASKDRVLIGDDEHGWSHDGLFNFEGGCYAKTIDLSPEGEPEIFSAVNRFGCTLENVVFKDNSREVDFFDSTITENTRGGYPLSFISGASKKGCTGHPSNVIMLTADAFGVLPPLSLLSLEQAVYHFLSGYTARIAGTEQGVKEPQATFSACFGEPFMSRHPSVYAKLLQHLLEKHGTKCWLLNTGWTNGGYGSGERFPLSVTRCLLEAVLKGELHNASLQEHKIFRLQVPQKVQGVEAHYLDVRKTWKSREEYDKKALKLASMFRKNFHQFLPYVSKKVKDSSL